MVSVLAHSQLQIDMTRPRYLPSHTSETPKGQTHSFQLLAVLTPKEDKGQLFLLCVYWSTVTRCPKQRGSSCTFIITRNLDVLTGGKTLSGNPAPLDLQSFKASGQEAQIPQV